MQRPRRSSTKTLAGAVDQLLGDLGITKKLREYEAVTGWERIVGDHIAKVSEALRIQRGILLVRVKTSTWRNELQIRKHEIIRKLNDSLGEEIVKDIKFQ